jgi:hypothetical protein
MKYDPEDYCEELQRLACEGMATKDFIARSNPGPKWFRKYVMPIATMARCHACGRYFNPSKVGMLVECTKPRCAIALETRNK